ncbi:MAG TPA: endonuclease/exonuclease/phosphatase family protein [Candidatus Saccharimonadales bacterium]|nr:endonuclease/exonuclease/phosphatase family protein [Candidatus Saccharimonadales bacterium]
MSDKNSRTLSLLTLNTLGTPFFAPDITKRYKKIAELINEENYDIVCLQELFSYYHLLIFRKYLKNFPYVAFCPNPLGPRGGLVIFSKTKLTDTNFFTYSFPKEASVPFYAPISQPGMLISKCRDYQINIATTHLSSDIEHDLTPKNRLYALIKNQLEECANVVKRYAKNNDSFILAGDFNIAKESQLYKNFKSETSLEDIFISKNKPTYDPTRIKYFYKAKEGICDYVWLKTVTKQVAVAKTSYAFEDQYILSNHKKSFLSDHIGLLCTLSVNE